jgi:hypothetical protein
MRPFAEVLRDWQLFYATFATACATLVGLLFVAVSLNRENLSREDGGERMWIARQTFYQFLMLFLLALLLLAPHRSPTSVGLTLLGFGGFWSIGVVRAFLTSTRMRRQPLSWQGFVRGFGLSFAGLLSIFAVAVAMLLGQVGALGWLVVVLVNLLLFTGRNAWFLLVHIRKGDKWQQ